MFLFEASVKPQELPPNWSPDSRTFINSALKRKAEERLGSRGIEEVLMHRWLSDVDWRKMISKKFVSPFMPNMNNNNFDTVSES